MPPEGVRAAVAALARDEVAEQRWFGGKGAALGQLSLAGSLGPFGEDEWLLALAVGEETYLVPAALRDGRLAEARGPLWLALAEACRSGAVLQGEGLSLRGTGGPLPTPAVRGEIRPLGIDQSNTSVVVGERLVLKCYRRLHAGEHPEIELARHLVERGFAQVPALYGSAEARVGDVPGAGALLLQEYVVDGKDGWLAAEEELRALLEAADVASAAAAPLRWARAVGEATAELHALLAAAEDVGFAPRRAAPAELAELRAATEAELGEALALLDGEARRALADAEPALRERFALFERVDPPVLTRVHGDLHLGQFLHRGTKPPVIVDFEGEPTRAADERRQLASPLRDLAGLLRSVDHAGWWVSREASPVAEAWIAAARGSIRSAYERRLAELGAPFAVDDGLLSAFEAEKAVYEFVYAVRFLPSWLVVPQRALGSVVAGAARPSGPRDRPSRLAPG